MQIETRPEERNYWDPVNFVPPPRGRRRFWLVVAAILVVAIAFAVGVLPRVKAANTARTETDQLAIPTVSVIRPQQTAPSQEIVLPANVQPFSSAPIFARTNGYLQRWYVDIGANVKK